VTALTEFDAQAGGLEPARVAAGDAQYTPDQLDALADVLAAARKAGRVENRVRRRVGLAPLR